jgi:AcrR family transcriptional regulator
MQRMRILHALAEIVSEEGADAASVPRVCTLAGVPSSTFHELFRDRGECLKHAFDETVQRARANIGANASPLEGSHDRIRAGLLALLTFLEEEPELATLCISRSLAGKPEILTRRDRVIGELAAALQAELQGCPTGTPLPPSAARAAVVAAVSITQTRLATRAGPPLRGMVEQLMSVILLASDVSPVANLGPTQPAIPRATRRSASATGGDPREMLRTVGMRATYRTHRVLEVIARHPGASNRQVAAAAGVRDQGQISRLLGRLYRLQLIDAAADGDGGRAHNAWLLTTRGEDVRGALQHAPLRNRSPVPPSLHERDHG